MEQDITLTLTLGDAEMLVQTLMRRRQRLCDIRQEICEPDEFEQEEAAFFEQEEEVVGRILAALRSALAKSPAH
jgi:hypothetical protein